jgi:hypothetical protein
MSGYHSRAIRSLAIALVIVLVLPAVVEAQSQGTPGRAPAAIPVTVAAARIPTAPIVDGDLSDAVWTGLQPLSGFTQRVPRDGEPATFQTEVRIGYDDAALYVGIRALDDRPDLIVPGDGIRDFNLTQSDALVLIFDTYNDGVNGFVFGTNPAGIEYDGQVVDQGSGGGGLRPGGVGSGRQQGGSGGGFNLNWDGSWEVASSRDAGGWSAEFRIPFSTLRYRAGTRQDWGFNVLRRVRRVNEESFWSPIPREFDLYRVSEAGTLVGLDPPVRRSAQVTPYFLGSTARNYAVSDPNFNENWELGGDAKIQVTQGLTLDLTYNTDFAQVEVDEVQTNLTRFSISFPEKRPFFLENAGMFSVGGRGSDLFFSRRIGISPNGTQVPIQGGGRLSGKLAGTNLGLLHIRSEGVVGAQSGQAYTVARVARELKNRSSVGGIFLQRDGVDLKNDYNRTYGADAQLGLGSAWTFNALAARTETPDLDGKDHIIRLSGSYSTRSLGFNGSFREVGDDFNPEVGFSPRAGFRDYRIMWQSYLRPESFLGLREIRPHARYTTVRDLETGFEETSMLHLDSQFEWDSGHFLSTAFNWNREGLDMPFEISEGVVVPPGTYDGWEIAPHVYTNPAAPVAFDTRLDWGAFLSGTRRSHRTQISFRHGSAFSTALRLEYNDIHLAQGDFITRLAGLRMGYFFTPQIYLQSLVQYNDQEDNWSANVRFGWLGTAGTGLFVVYNEANGVNALSGPINRSLTVKYSRQFTAWGG